MVTKLFKHGEADDVMEFIPPHTGAEPATGIQPFLLRQVNPDLTDPASAPSSDETDPG